MLDVGWVAGGGEPRDHGGPAGRIGCAVVDRCCEMRGMLVGLQWPMSIEVVVAFVVDVAMVAMMDLGLKPADFPGCFS
jgi:hypothetical protein